MLPEKTSIDGNRTIGAANGLHDLRRQPKAHILRHYLYFFDARKPVKSQIIDDVFH